MQSFLIFFISSVRWSLTRGHVQTYARLLEYSTLQYSTHSTAFLSNISLHSVGRPHLKFSALLTNFIILHYVLPEQKHINKSSQPWKQLGIMNSVSMAISQLEFFPLNFKLPLYWRKESGTLLCYYVFIITGIQPRWCRTQNCASCVLILILQGRSF